MGIWTVLFYENRESLVLGGRWVGGRDENREALVYIRTCIYRFNFGGFQSRSNFMVVLTVLISECSMFVVFTSLLLFGFLYLLTLHYFLLDSAYFLLFGCKIEGE